MEVCKDGLFERDAFCLTIHFLVFVFWNYRASFDLKKVIDILFTYLYLNW